MGNWVSSIIEHLLPEHWYHVQEAENPADCASRDIFFVKHSLWWNGLLAPLPPNNSSEEEGVNCLLTTIATSTPIIPFDCFSNFTQLKHVTAWIFCFKHNCLAHVYEGRQLKIGPLTVEELQEAEIYWMIISQKNPYPSRKVLVLTSLDIAVYCLYILLWPYSMLVEESIIQNCRIQPTPHHHSWETPIDGANYLI